MLNPDNVNDPTRLIFHTFRSTGKQIAVALFQEGNCEKIEHVVKHLGTFGNIDGGNATSVYEQCNGINGGDS